MTTDRRLWFTHKCRFCSYFFVSEKDLVCHEATHDAPNFACDSCSCVFDDAEQLSVHTSDGCLAADSFADVGRQHVCRTCGEIFRFVRELYKHYSEHHMGEKSPLPPSKSDVVDGSSVCADCGAMFSCTASLKVHLWKAHNLNVVQQEDHIVKKNGPSSGTCNDSHTESTCRQIVMSAEEKPFKCSMCNWSFKYDFSFHAHLKMHAEKQRLLNEMLRANCENQTSSSVIDKVQVNNDGRHTVVSGSSDLRVPLVLLPLKRKLDSDRDGSSGAKANVVYGTKYSRSGCYLTTKLAVNTDCAKQLSGVVLTDQRSLKPVTVTQVSSELLNSSTSLSPVISNAGHAVARQLPSVDCTTDSEEPFQFACKLCSFKCRYDFSYIAHLNQHDKLKELEIDDLQSHLVASSTETSSGSHVHNKFAVKVVNADGGVSRDNGHVQLVDSPGISYILLCPGAVDQNAALVASLPDHRLCDDAVVPQAAVSASVAGTVAAVTTDCFDSNVVFVDDVSTSIEQDLNSRPATAAAAAADDDDDDADFSVGPEMHFLDSVGGETLYVINETDLQVALPMDSSGEHQKNVVYEDAESEVILSPQPTDRQLLDVVSFCNEDNGHSDELVADNMDSFTCYYCNAVFADKSHLQRHILQLHVD